MFGFNCVSWGMLGFNCVWMKGALLLLGCPVITGVPTPKAPLKGFGRAPKQQLCSWGCQQLPAGFLVTAGAASLTSVLQNFVMDHTAAWPPPAVA